MSGSPPGKKRSLSARIESLQNLRNVDTMLMEGMSAPDVAQYLQEDLQLLTDVPPSALAAALKLRRRQKEDISKRYAASAGGDEEGGLYEGDGDQSEVMDRKSAKAIKPSFIAKRLYNKTRKGIKDLVELEALYLTQRDRIDRMVEIEFDRGMFAKDVGDEIATGSRILIERLKAKQALGIEDDSDELLPIDMSKYSEKTVKALQNPETRHRVLGLMQRLAKANKLKGLTVDSGSEEQIELPMPESTED